MATPHFSVAASDNSLQDPDVILTMLGWALDSYVDVHVPGLGTFGGILASLDVDESAADAPHVVTATLVDDEGRSEKVPLFTPGTVVTYA